MEVALRPIMEDIVFVGLLSHDFGENRLKDGEAVGAFQGTRLRAFGTAFVSLTMGLAFARIRATCFLRLRVLKSSTICREYIDDSSFLTKAFQRLSI